MPQKEKRMLIEKISDKYVWFILIGVIVMLLGSIILISNGIHWGYYIFYIFWTFFFIETLSDSFQVTNTLLPVVVMFASLGFVVLSQIHPDILLSITKKSSMILALIGYVLLGSTSYLFKDSAEKTVESIDSNDTLPSLKQDTAELERLIKEKENEVSVKIEFNNTENDDDFLDPMVF